jgi:hypothetical protein
MCAGCVGLDHERAELCGRIRAATAALPPSVWTVEELRPLAALLESVERAHARVDEVGNVVYFGRWRGIR